MHNLTKETTVAEQRAEPRYETGDCIAQILMAEEEITCEGVVMDVSRSGLRLRTDCHLKDDRMVTVRVGHITVAGRVRYCQRNQDGTFDTGVLICDIK